VFWKSNISNKFGLNLETVFSYICSKDKLQVEHKRGATFRYHPFLLANIRLGRKCLTWTNTLAYLVEIEITLVNGTIEDTHKLSV
jgi:hypothetical protein